MNNEVNNKKKLIVIVVVALVLALIAFAITLIVRNINSNNKTELTVLVAPETAKVEINGKEYKNGTYDFAPGTYSVSLSADGFESKTVELTANSGEIALLYDYLLPTSGKYSLKDYDLLKYLSKDETTKSLLEARASAVSFLSLLPYDFPDEGVSVEDFSSSSECPADPNLCIKVTSLSLSKEDALALIKAQGYDLTDLTVFFDQAKGE